MANVTVSVPDELKARMDKQAAINWSAVARTAFEKHVAFAEELDRIMANPNLEDEDFVELGRIINRGMQDQYRKKIVLAQAKQMKGETRTTANAARRRR